MEDLNQPVNNEDTELTRLTPSSRSCHIAVRVEDCVVVTGGINICTCRIKPCLCTIKSLPLNEVWVYNLYTDKWSKYLIPSENETPKNVDYYQGVLIGGDIYLLCRGKTNGEYTFTLWVLRNPLDKLAAYWEKVQIASQDRQPSPREGYGCWTYGGKLLIFGGVGQDDDGERTDEYNNELISFDPGTKLWCNQQCSGNIPSPRTDFCSDIMDDKVWLFGGWKDSDYDFEYLYTLHMESEPYVWTRVLTSSPAGLQLISPSFTAVSNSLVLNDKFERDNGYVQETWIIDLSSCSWKLQSRSEEMRSCHVSCKGLNNDVIVIGGYILKGDVDNTTGQVRFVPVEGNFVRHILPQPKSLEQLALKAVYTHRNILPWKDPYELPEYLITRLQDLVD